MSHSTRTVAGRVPADAGVDWEIEPMVEQLWSELDGAVPRSTIRQTVTMLFHKYDDATVMLYVPIFVRRQAQETLQRL